MGWRQWSLVAVVIGGGILLQIPGHDSMEMPARGDEAHRAPPAMVEMPAPYTTVALQVTGMT